MEVSFTTTFDSIKQQCCSPAVQRLTAAAAALQQAQQYTGCSLLLIPVTQLLETHRLSQQQ
jgi:hypothetical protein